MVIKNRHSNFSILRGPVPYAVGAGDLDSSATHPWRAVAAANLDGGDYDEIVAVRKVGASGVPDLVVARADPSSCEVSTVIARATLGNPSNSEWLDAAVGDFDGSGTKQIVLLKAAHPHFSFVKFVPPNTLTVLPGADFDSLSAFPWKAVAAGDIDGEPGDELIVARQVGDGRGPTVLVFKWTGSEFKPIATSTFGNNGNSNWASAAVGDFNADGRKAIVLVRNQHPNFVVLDLPKGATQLRRLSTSTSIPQKARIGAASQRSIGWPAPTKELPSSSRFARRPAIIGQMYLSMAMPSIAFLATLRSTAPRDNGTSRVERPSSK